MKRLLAVLTTLAVLCSTFAATVTPASAGDRYDRGYHDRGWRHHGHRGFDGGDALAAGVIGLGVGALLGGALADGNRRYYDDGPRYRTYGGDYYGGPILEGPVIERRYIEVERPLRSYRDAPRAYRSGYSHVAACEARYRSYDRRTDTFVGYDGVVRRCRM
ncbi:MAG: BA14K family protein [Rhizobiaceae bacterium]|nr:BA14K family protein [Rhizobiaceae bacterium]